MVARSHWGNGAKQSLQRARTCGGSTTGWVVTMYGDAVSQSSKKQATTAASSMDQFCGAAMREGLSLIKVLKELALLSTDIRLVRPVTIGCDNTAAFSLCKDCKEGQRVKQTNIIHHLARDHVANGDPAFVYCKSRNNVSDCLTKALPRLLFEKGLEGLGKKQSEMLSWSPRGIVGHSVWLSVWCCQRVI
jgi:hypothetical protein